MCALRSLTRHPTRSALEEAGFPQKEKIAYAKALCMLKSNFRNKLIHLKATSALIRYNYVLILFSLTPMCR
jgi:hypothetical protein